MEKAEIVVDETFPPDDEPTRVVKPGKEALDLPSSPGASQGPAVLRRDLPRRTVSRDHFDPPACHQRVVEAIAVVGLVANQSRREVFEEARLERVFDEPDFGR